MRKQLRIIKDEEFKIQIREKINEYDPFFEQYQQATYLLEKILRAAENERHDSSGNITEYSNNIIAFCGERGDGKSSAMMSFINELENNKKYSILFSNTEFIKKIDFVDILYIDPTTLDQVHNILDIVLAQLFIRFKHEYDKDRWENKKIDADKLIESFQKVYKMLSIIKDSNTVLQEEFDAAGSLAKLERLSGSINLKKELRILLQNYYSYMSDTNDEKKLIIAVDDLDLSLAYAYQMSEQIRKYLIIPELSVIMAVRREQLNLAVQEYDANQLQTLTLRDEDRHIIGETLAMANQYTSKLIPLTHMIVLPKIQDWKGIELVFVDHNGKEEKEFEGNSVAISVLKIIHRKTGMVFLADSDEHSMLLPDNLRGVINLLVYLYSLKTPKDWDDYETKEKNIKSFFNIYCGAILPSLPPLLKGNHITSQIQNLVLRGTMASLHQDVANVLQEIDMLYYSTWTEGEKKARHEEWLDMASDTSRGMNSLNFVIQGLNRLLIESSRYELRKHLYAICIFYTIKANLALINSKRYEYERYRFSSYTDSYVWGRLFLNILPAISEPGGLIPRLGIRMISAKIFNCIAGEIHLTNSYRLLDEGDMRVKVFNNKSPLERTKFILTWILMAFLSNGYVSIKKPPQYVVGKEQYHNTAYIYSNYSTQQYKHINLENYFVKPAVLEAMYEKLNLKILDISEKEFNDVVINLKNNNEKLCKVSEVLTTNVDIILQLPKVVWGEYKNVANSSLKRTEELVNDVFEKVCKLLKELDKNNELTRNISVDDLRYVKFGKRDMEKINIAHLYAVLIEQARTAWTQHPVRDTALEYEVQKLRDILELKNMIKNPKVLDYSIGTNRTTKWRNLREKIEQMTKSIAAYIYWSKDYAYLSQTTKDNLCSFYYQILEKETNNPNDLATDEMKLKYKSFASEYSSKELKDKIAIARSNVE